jgi:hypothetical protein
MCHIGMARHSASPTSLPVPKVDSLSWRHCLTLSDSTPRNTSSTCPAPKRCSRESERNQDRDHHAYHEVEKHRAHSGGSANSRQRRGTLAKDRLLQRRCVTLAGHRALCRGEGAHHQALSPHRRYLVEELVEQLLQNQ